MLQITASGNQGSNLQKTPGRECPIFPYKRGKEQKCFSTAAISHWLKAAPENGRHECSLAAYSED